MAKGAYAVHAALLGRLQDYLKSQYLGKSPTLLRGLKGKLDARGGIFQEPYVESSQAYRESATGIAGANIPGRLKQFFLRLSEAGLGVYPTPYAHQVMALEAAMKGRDVFVSTGTGSGKTECFMWPIVAKLFMEASAKPTCWEQRGIRTIILYPMNALVSDQLSRLRRLIGDPQHRFVAAFRDGCGYVARRPQFGMYTGRTPYPGEKPNSQEDGALAKTLKMILPPAEEERMGAYHLLLEQGKVPAKENLAEFIQRLKSHDHTPDPDDAELLTRFEMQRSCPDILITNYSMLEYMLLRPREQHIWNETRTWLEMDLSNRILFVIDEAHMYRGASGGEVALLIRRLFRKLGIGRDRVQFILTTASMPYSKEKDREAVSRFFIDLTAASGIENMLFLQGERKPLPSGVVKDIPDGAFDLFDLGHFEDDEKSQLAILNSFWREAGGSMPGFASLDEAGIWMYQHLLDYNPFRRLASECRGVARSLDELRSAIFPHIANQEMGRRFVSVLLAIASLAKDGKNVVLFPIRMHMLFRGLQGVFACANPNCPGHIDGEVALGEVTILDGHTVCEHCGSVVYELFNDRRCGALFYRGYVTLDKSGHLPRGPVYLWHHAELGTQSNLVEMDLYVAPNDYVPQNTKRIKPCYLDLKSGFVYFDDDQYDGQRGYRRFYYNATAVDGNGGGVLFKSCPHCGRPLRDKALVNFATRGNQAFYNLVATQFNLQPAVAGKDACPATIPNQGRKVLLFSDSRQRAARLARDMSDYSDDDAARAVVALALREMAKKDDPNLSVDDFYGNFVLQAAMAHTHLFSGADARSFWDACVGELRRAERRLRRGGDYSPQVRFADAPDSAKCVLLKLFASPYNTLQDIGMSWLDPVEESLLDALQQLEEFGCKTSKDEFLAFFNSWMLGTVYPNVALGSLADGVRETIRDLHDSFGLLPDWKFPEWLRRTMDWRGKEAAQVEENWKKALTDNFLRLQGERYFVEINSIRPVFGFGREMVVCKACGGLSPRALKGCCPRCGGAVRNATDEDYEAYAFWRTPICAAMNGENIRVIDTEEHTAQLSHKDQRDALWSKTEKYELLFQDLLDEGDLPVDILSSTTTMEVGIDIGSLVAVALRNVPPMRENYQQRAGRAGRRGACLSTILTFCEDGPHDSLYFKEPREMFSGDPRRPWIDVRNAKLVFRHMAMLVFQDFLVGKGMDAVSAMTFLNNLADFEVYLKSLRAEDYTGWIPQGVDVDFGCFKAKLLLYVKELKKKVETHPELYRVENQYGHDVDKPLLDALYEEALIPTYSFPKNVVSLNVTDSQGNLRYSVQRGLDIALNEYAPGRAVVIDKETYQVGGIYSYGSERPRGCLKSPARAFVNDANYLKRVQVCDSCEWFGIVTNDADNAESCPFCGGRVRMFERALLKPWGFAPKNAQSIPLHRLEEEYSSAQVPLYSTVPSDSSDMREVKGWDRVRCAVRENQQIVVVNKGPGGKGFLVCSDCGAAMPDGKDALAHVGRPYRSYLRVGKCPHSDMRHVNLGFDFITDMLVMEIMLDGGDIDTNRGGLWLRRAAQTLAEAVRLEVCRKLDVEFSELATGYRLRSLPSSTAVDIYVYDNLSSGAGYSVAIQNELSDVLEEVYSRLSDCNCESACYSCLKHYRNQSVHSLLDRHTALQLLEWGRNGKLPPDLPIQEQRRLVSPLAEILSFRNISVSESGGHLVICRGENKFGLTVYPGMRVANDTTECISLSDVCLRYDRPYALEKIREHFERWG